MKSYLVPGLDVAQKQRLTDAGINFYAFDDTSVIVEEPQLAALLSALGATATESATEFENMFKLKLRFRKAQDQAAAAPLPVRGDPALAQARQQYIAICGERVKKALKAAADNVGSLKRDVADYQQRFFDLTRLDAFGRVSMTEDEQRRALAEEFERLRAVPRVLDVRVIQGAVLVYTDVLYAIHPETGATHELGKFMLYINVDGKNDGVRWFNSTRRVDAVRANMNAPYVYESGKARVTELKETFVELIGRLELSAVAELSMQFVETVEDDEMGRMLDHWPLASS